jgi:poly-gamma-glutamate synthesis protein (capsule biosynthesis protein)
MTSTVNGIPMPTEAPWSVKFMDHEWAIEQAKAARKQGADIVFATMHSGDEYTEQPNWRQLGFADALAESGEFDLLIGTHSHVPQPARLLPGGVNGKGMWVVYGLGNYVTAQTELLGYTQNSAVRTGIIAFAEVEVIPGEPLRLSELTYAAVTADSGDSYRLHVLTDLQSDPSASTLSSSMIDARIQQVTNVLGSELLRTTAPTPTGDRAVVIPRPR